MKENWKPAPDYEGYYEVSDQGRVRSLDRVVLQRNPYSDKARKVYKGRILALRHKTGGYLNVKFCVDQKHRELRVHRLVLQAFDPREDWGQCEVNHINNVRDDNRLENLEWSSRSENMKHAYKHGEAVSPLKDPEVRAKRWAK
jgi:hypothetical protein